MAWPRCDWCGAAAVRIGAVETGMMRRHGSVWLCLRPGCGHEMERFDADVPLECWREALLDKLECRALVLIEYALSGPSGPAQE